MKKLIALFLAFLLLLQAIPVVPQLLCDDVTVSWVDEDKPGDGKMKEKKDGKEFLSLSLTPVISAEPVKPACAPLRKALPCPHLERFTPPPNC
ncbi:hypothetical protein [Flaviaesturariibacter terrae]